MSSEKKKSLLMVNLMEKYNSSNIYDYIFVGGSRGANFKYLKQLCKDNKFLNDSINVDCLNFNGLTNCICGHIIKELCFIIKKTDELIFDNFIIIGNCCIKHWNGGKKLKKNCSICGNTHRNSKNNICSICRNIKKKKDKVINDLINEIESREIIKHITLKNYENDFYYFMNNAKIQFGKYKNINNATIFDFLKDLKYTEYLISVIDTNNIKPIKYNYLNNAIKTFCYIEYISKILKELHKHKPYEFISDDLYYYM